jgi:aryl-alcohol dehydrogenase-like predicted oxidoreductase
MPAWQVVDSLWVSRSNNLARFIACEDEYSLLGRGIERELLPAMEAMGLGLLPYYPLASGLLTGKYQRNQPLPADSRFAVITERDYVGQFLTEANLARLDGLTAFATQRGYQLLDVAISWLHAQPLVASVIAGATKPEQVEANVKAAALKLTADDMAELDKITAGSDSAQS